MRPFSRLLTCIVLLVAVLLGFAGMLAGAGVCTDECGAACGDCGVCGIAGCLTAPAGLRAEIPLLAIVARHSARPSRIAARAIEHVPLCVA